MPIQRLEKARASLPLGYQFGDAAKRCEQPSCPSCGLPIFHDSEGEYCPNCGPVAR